MVKKLFKYLKESNPNFTQGSYYIGIQVANKENIYDIVSDFGERITYDFDDVNQKESFQFLTGEEILDFFLDVVIGKTWNSTSTNSSITKVLVALNNTNLWATIESDWSNQNRQKYMVYFYENIKILNEVLNFDDGVMSNILTLAILKDFRVNNTLKQNFKKLLENDMLRCLYSFNDKFRGEIIEIKNSNIENFKIILTDEYVYIYQVDEKSIVTQCFNSTEEALIYILFGEKDYSTVLKLYEATNS
jgi:hypothetical protein